MTTPNIEELPAPETLAQMAEACETLTKLMLVIPGIDTGVWAKTLREANERLEALGREVARLTVERDVNKRMRDQHFTELAAIRATDKDAGLVADGYPCEIEEADFEKNTITLKMMTSNYQVSAGKYLLKEEPKIGGV